MVKISAIIKKAIKLIFILREDFNMEERKRGRGGFIVLMCFLLLLIAALATAAILALVPKRSNPLKPSATGIGFESLVGGEFGWMNGGLKANLLSVAITRGSKVDASEYGESLATLQLESNGSPASVTLLRNAETGELAFTDQNGNTTTHIQTYLSWLLDDKALDPVFCKAVPLPITVENHPVEACSYDYRGASLFGEPLRFSKTLEGNDTSQFLSLTFDNVTTFSIEGLPANAKLAIQKSESESQEQVFSGSYSDLSTFVPESHIPYLFILSTADSGGNVAEYRFLVTYLLRPVFSVTPTNLKTGNNFLIQIDGIREGDQPKCTLPFEYNTVFSINGNTATAIVPISHTFAPGDYNITVFCGDYDESFSFTVTEEAYEKQELTITGDGAAANTADANKEYVDTMYPLFKSVDPNIYWEGLFIQPVEGTITTQYGIYRYTNGSTTPTRHAGIDIANDEGTPIVAPNKGKVIYSGFLTLSGETMLIEHGMGLHTLYMHMSKRMVEAGEMVDQGQVIGMIGTTGYSTGPHLHYQMMIQDYSISPWYAQDGTAGFYALKPEEPAP